MNKIQFSLIGFLVVIAACSGASEGEHRKDELSTQVILPDGSELTYKMKPSQPDYFYFDGELVATGIVLAYWQVNYLEAEPTTLDQADPVREMHLRFYPDARSKHLLPEFQISSEQTVRHQRIFLYRARESGESLDTLLSAYEESDMPQVKEIVQNFAELPASFLTHREGFALQPASLVLTDLLSFVEGDHRFLYGRAKSIEQLSMTEYGLKQIPDSDPDSFLGEPWLETFYAPDPLVVRESPDQAGRVIAEFPSGASFITKLRTVDEAWVLVKVSSNEDKAITGYVKMSELMVVN